MEKTVKRLTAQKIGEMLMTDFLMPLELSQNALALALGVAPPRINDIVSGKRGISIDTDLRLTKYFGLPEGYFLHIQEQLNKEKTIKEIHKDLDKIIPLSKAKKAKIRLS